MSVSGFDKFRWGWWMWIHMGKNCNLKLTVHFGIWRVIEVARHTTKISPIWSHTRKSSKILIFIFEIFEKNLKKKISFELKFIEVFLEAKMKIFAYILLLQMIDARNFAKAKRNIFKIQLKREPRRKRKTVSYERKFHLPEYKDFYNYFCEGIKSFGFKQKSYLSSQITFTFEENEKTEWWLAKFNMCCR